MTYKTVIAPKIAAVRSGRAEKGLRVFEQIINQMAQQGFTYHSMETISLTEKKGFLFIKRRQTVDSYMLIFYK
jgi:hypothetical protein